MISLRHITILLISLSFGCSSAGLCLNNHIAVAPSISNVAEQDLQQAASVWNNALGRQVVLITDLVIPNTEVSEVSKLPERFPNALGIASARWNPIDGSFVHCQIKLLDGQWDLRILVHELGHCMGLKHDNPAEHPKSIMLPAVPPSYVLYPHHLTHIAECPLMEESD